MGNNAQAIAAIGLQVQQQNIESIANNLTNVGTVGYKSGRLNFQDLMQAPAAAGGIGTGLGAGVAVGGLSKDFSAGRVTPTESPLDVAILGNGFIEVALPDGSMGYTRGGTLQVNADSVLATASGNVLHPRIQIPANYTAMAIGPDGKVMVRRAGESAAIEVGQIGMAGFTNPAGLKAVGDTTYVPTELSGVAVAGRGGEDGLGTLAQYRIEASNVNLINEMTSLMTAQRAFEMSSKAFTAADEMLQIANNLRR